MAKNKNGASAKRNKKRDATKTLRTNSHIADNFIVYSIDGVANGVKYASTMRDTKVSAQEHFILTSNIAQFNFVIGVAGRDEQGNNFVYEKVCRSARCRGYELTPTFQSMAQEMLKEIGKKEMLTSYYFATTNDRINFDDECTTIKFLDDHEVFTKLCTWREHTIDVKQAMEQKMKYIDYNKTQVGGTHYSKYTVQPRHVFTAIQLGWDLANAIKYIVRFRDKNGKEDLEKAFDYIARSRVGGLENFYQRRTTKAQRDLFKTFASQFEPPIESVLNTILNVYNQKYESEQHFEDVMSALLFEINSIAKALYNEDLY